MRLNGQFLVSYVNTVHVETATKNLTERENDQIMNTQEKERKSQTKWQLQSVTAE